MYVQNIISLVLFLLLQRFGLAWIRDPAYKKKDDESWFQWAARERKAIRQAAITNEAVAKAKERQAHEQAARKEEAAKAAQQ